MPISLVHCLRDTPLAFVDVETTGASADFGHRVIEIGVARVEGGQIVARYEQLIDPQRRISPGVTAMTGISQAMVTGQPTFAQQFPAMLPLLKDAIVLGHNVRFDLSFLRREFRRCGTELTAALGDGVHVLDTVRIARKRFGRGGNALQLLAPRLGMRPQVAHRALADALTTAFVFEKLMEPVGGWACCVCDAIREQGGPMGLMPATPRESLLPLELEEALEQRVPVQMEYLDARQNRTHRVIEPLTIRRSGGELIMVAYCHMRQDRRTFKLDRVVQLAKAGTPPQAPPNPVPAPTSPGAVDESPAPPAAAEAPPVVLVSPIQIEDAPVCPEWVPTVETSPPNSVTPALPELPPHTEPASPVPPLLSEPPADGSPSFEALPATLEPAPRESIAVPEPRGGAAVRCGVPAPPHKNADPDPQHSGGPDREPAGWPKCNASGIRFAVI